MKSVEWCSLQAISELQGYCDLVSEWEKEIESTEVCKDRKCALIDTTAIMSSYALEIAIKSFVSMDSSHAKVECTHDLLKLYDNKDMTEDTRGLLKQAGITRQFLENNRAPFIENRYSMDNNASGKLVTYRASSLRKLVQLLNDKLPEAHCIHF